MSTPSLPPSNRPEKKPAVSLNRLVIWIAVAGVGLYLVISGIVGIIAKGG